MQRLKKRSAFSLVELLIVIAIMATLVGLAIAAIQGVRNAADCTRCENNLHQIGIAYHGFVDSRNGKTSAFLGDMTWRSQIAPFLEKKDEMFFCQQTAPPKEQPVSNSPLKLYF